MSKDVNEKAKNKYSHLKYVVIFLLVGILIAVCLFNVFDTEKKVNNSVSANLQQVSYNNDKDLKGVVTAENTVQKLSLDNVLKNII